MKNTLLFLNGLSGSGKNYFLENHIPKKLFYNLIVAATRPPRDDEVHGVHRYFVDEKFFHREKFATWSWVNEFIWKPGEPKWMYGVPESEVLNNLGKNLTYDVIEPRYTRQMIDWFKANKLDKYYDFKIAFFLPPENNFEIAARRANMPNDDAVRRNNTCDPIDFLRAGLHPDWFLKSSEKETIIDPNFKKYIDLLLKQKIK